MIFFFVTSHRRNHLSEEGWRLFASNTLIRALWTAMVQLSAATVVLLSFISVATAANEQRVVVGEQVNVAIVYREEAGTYDGYRERDGASIAVSEINADANAIGEEVVIHEFAISESQAGACSASEDFQTLEELRTQVGGQNFDFALIFSNCPHEFGSNPFGNAIVIQASTAEILQQFQNPAAPSSTHFFRVSATVDGDADGQVIANYLEEVHAESNIAMIPPLGVVMEGGDSYLRSIEAAINARGIQERLYLEQRNDLIDYGLFGSGYDDIISLLVGEEIDVVILSVTGIGGHDISFLEQMREDVGSIDTILVGPSEWGEGIHPNLSQVIDEAGAGADGTYAVLAQSPCLQDQVRDLFDMYLAECSLDSVLVYSAFQAWSEAFGISNTKEPDQISEVLRTHPINTILGPLTFDQDGNAIVQLKRMHIRIGGEYRPL